MKSLSCLVAILLLLTAVASQDFKQPTLYQPYSQEEMQEVTNVPEIQMDPLSEITSNRHHNYPKRPPMESDYGMEPAEGMKLAIQKNTWTQT